MHKSVLLFIIITMTIIMFTCCENASSQDNDGKVYMTAVQGEVDVGKIDSTDINDDDVIGEGWYIATGEDSSAILYINDLVVKINENSRIEITKSKYDYTRFNLKYGSIKVDSRQTYEEKDVIVDAEDNTIQTEEHHTLFELDFDSETEDLDYDVKQGKISITSDDVKIYINSNGVEKVEPVENDVTPNVEDDDDDFYIPDYDEIFINNDENDVGNTEEVENNEWLENEDNLDYEEEIEINENNDHIIDYEDETDENNDHIIDYELDEEEMEEIPIVEDKIDEEKPQSIDEIIDDETLDEIEEKGMDINKGLDPPNIEGKYLVDDLYLIYDSKYPPHYFDPGYEMKDYIYIFYDQTNDHNIKVKYQVTDNPSVYGGGDGAFISGSGNKFTIYLRTKSKLTGAYLSTLQIISGVVTDKGIENFKIALIIMGKEGATVHNIEMEDFPPIGTKRIIIAKTLAERIN